VEMEAGDLNKLPRMEGGTAPLSLQGGSSYLIYADAAACRAILPNGTLGTGKLGRQPVMVTCTSGLRIGRQRTFRGQTSIS